MLGLLPAGEKKREGEDYQHQQLLALQRSHTFISNSDNDSDDNHHNDSDNDDNDNGDHLILLALSCFMLIVMILTLSDYVELGRERKQTPCNLAEVAGKQKLP